MKDPRSVLRQKDLDLERVRKEIQALLIVIPLLADDQTSSDVMQESCSCFLPEHQRILRTTISLSWRSTTPSSGTCEYPSAQSREYCLEMICADLLAGANLETKNPESWLLGLSIRVRNSRLEFKVTQLPRIVVTA